MIKVYNEKQQLVAVFDKDASGVYTEDAKKDILVAPYVDNTINSESTLNFQILKDSKKWQQVNNPLYEWHVRDRVYIATKPEAFIYEGDLVNVTLVEKWYELSKCYGQVHNVDVNIEALDEHTVKVLPKTKPEFKMTVNGVKYDDSVIKDSRGILLPRGSAGYALWGLIKANKLGWTLGVCDVIVDGFSASEDYGTFNLETDMENILSNIQAVQSLWGGILVWDSLNKVVHLRDETKPDSDFNKWKGFTVRKGKNMLSEPILNVDNDIITKAYILGNNNLNIKKVNNNKTYIENYSYTKNVYEGYLTNPNIYYTGAGSTSGQKQLLEWGKRELEKLCKPREQSSINIIDRSEEKAFSHEKFEIGDNVKVYYEDTKGNTVVKMQRIIQHSFNVWDISDATILVGDVIMNQRDIYKLVYDNALNPYLNSEDITLNLDGTLSEYYNGGTRKTLYDLLEGNAYIVTEFRKHTDEEFIETRAGIELLSDNLGSQITLLAEFKREVDDMFFDSYAYIDVIASEIETSITLAVSSALGDGVIYVSDTEVNIGLDAGLYRGRIRIDDDGILLVSTGGNIELSSETGINMNTAGYIDLYADTVNIYGNIYANNLLTISDFRSSSATVVTNVNFESKSTSTQTINYLQLNL